MNILIVRLGALGDVVHAVPAAAALRAAFPDARIDWLVERKHRAIVDLVTAVDRPSSLERRRGRLDGRRPRAAAGAYDVAIDLQGLMKSAVLARASGAARVVGFSIWHLREKTARPFYSDAHEAEGGHVIRKNLRLLRAVGVQDETIRFPLADVPSPALDDTARASRRRRFALINPGAAWPNKRWPPARFGEVAAFLRDACGLTPVVLWGPGEEGLAGEVVAASSGAAIAAPRPTVADLVALARAAALVVSGDTGSAAHRDGRRHADREPLRSDRSRAQRPFGPRDVTRLALRQLRLSLRSALPRATLVPRRASPSPKCPPPCNAALARMA